MNEFEKKLQDEVDRYKHELFSEQDLNEQFLEKNKRLEKENKRLKQALLKVIETCDECGVDWYDQIAFEEEDSKLLEKCINTCGWTKGIAQFFIEKVEAENG